jgi:hypothetical protein
MSSLTLLPSLSNTLPFSIIITGFGFDISIVLLFNIFSIKLLADNDVLTSASYIFSTSVIPLFINPLIISLATVDSVDVTEAFKISPLLPIIIKFPRGEPRITLPALSSFIKAYPFAAIVVEGCAFLI